jgi:glucitol operon activator protein
MDATYHTDCLCGYRLEFTDRPGFLQMRAFNRMLQDDESERSVKIGKTSSRWKPKTLVV